MSCHCVHPHSGYASCFCNSNRSQFEEYNLQRLKTTNYELKTLINKVDQLTDSISMKCLCQASPYYDDNIIECSICRDARLLKAKTRYEYVLCQDCDTMLSRGRDIQKRPVFDSNVYPLSKYPAGSQRYCSDCEECRETRRRSRSRSVHSLRSFNASRSRSPFSINSDVKPNWNGGNVVFLFHKIKFA